MASSVDNLRHKYDNDDMRLKYDNTIKCTFFWKIENFENRKQRSGEKLTSETFEVSLPDGKVTRWEILIYPKGQTPAEDGYVSIKLKSKNDVDLMTNFQFSVLDFDFGFFGSGQKKNLYRMAKSHLFTSVCDQEGFSKFLETKTINEILELEDLEIVCDLSINSLTECKLDKNDEDRKIDRESTFQDIFEKSQQQVCDDMRKLFLDKELSDVQLVCGDTVFDCHVTMLSARSAVFRAMFQTDMAEKKERKVKIEGFSPEIIREMLSFIYSGWKHPFGLHLEVAEELMSAADFYQLDLLKQLCEEKLCASLSVGNCVKYLVLADMHNTDKLKMKAMIVVVKNMRELVEDADEWKKFVKNYPGLTVEITKEMVEQKIVLDDIVRSLFISQ